MELERIEGRPVRVWMLKADGRLEEMQPADQRKPMTTPEQIVLPEFDPDPSVEEYRERIFTRYAVEDGGRLVAYVYADHAPSAEEMARVRAANRARGGSRRLA